MTEIPPRIAARAREVCAATQFRLCSNEKPVHADDFCVCLRVAAALMAQMEADCAAIRKLYKDCADRGDQLPLSSYCVAAIRAAAEKEDSNGHSG
jgi:hypothetical protein